MTTPKVAGLKTRNLEATKTVILLSAQEAFSAASFEKVRLKDIAQKANIDVALVNRYYGSKKDLFQRVLDYTHENADLFEGVSRENLAEKLVLSPHETEPVSPKRRLLMIGTYSVTNPEVQQIIQESSMRYFVKPLIKIIGGSQAQQKALLITSILFGYALSSRLIFSEPFRKNSSATTKTLRSLIQFVLDAP